MAEAKLIAENEYGVELRYARRKADVWPGYDETFPLGKAGYWLGTHQDHRYLGRTRDVLAPALLSMYGLREV